MSVPWPCLSPSTHRLCLVTALLFLFRQSGKGRTHPLEVMSHWRRQRVKAKQSLLASPQW